MPSLWRSLTAASQELRFRWLCFLHSEEQGGGGLGAANGPTWRIPRLMVFLRATPWWRMGHVRLAEDALLQRDLPLAFASGQAALVLSRTAGQRVGAALLVARALLAGGSPVRARAVLEPLRVQHPERFDLIEELAACFLAEGDFAAARTMLEGIPQSSRSASSGAALTYLRNKEQQSHDH